MKKGKDKHLNFNLIGLMLVGQLFVNCSKNKSEKTKILFEFTIKRKEFFDNIN